MKQIFGIGAVGNLLMFSNAGFKIIVALFESNHSLSAMMFVRKEQRHLDTHWFFSKKPA